AKPVVNEPHDNWSLASGRAGRADPMNDIIFSSTGFVRADKGPLWVTVLKPTHIMIIGIPFGSHKIISRLAQGDPLMKVLSELSSFQKGETKIPLEGVRSIQWIEAESTVSCESRVISSFRTQRTFHERLEPASPWKLAWAELLGAAISLVGTV